MVPLDIAIVSATDSEEVKGRDCVVREIPYLEELF